MTYPEDVTKAAREVCHETEAALLPNGEAHPGWLTGMFDNGLCVQAVARAIIAERQRWEGGEVVAIPKSENHASSMALLGMDWLKQHAPERLRNVEAEAEDRGRQAERQRWQEWVETNQRLGLIDEAVMYTTFGQHHPKPAENGGKPDGSTAADTGQQGGA